MAWSVNLEYFFHIWFSINPQIGINKKNADRLRAFKRENPAVTVTLIYSSDLLTPSANRAFQQFAHEIKISLFDIPIKNPQAIEKFQIRHGFSNNVDIKLYQLACEHLNALNSGGNPAFASDLLRWIFLSMGILDKRFQIYSDIDTKKNLAGIDVSQDIPVSASLLFPRGPDKSNNDVFALARYSNQVGSLDDSFSQLELLEDIKMKILDSCQHPTVNLTNLTNFTIMRQAKDKEPPYPVLPLLYNTPKAKEMFFDEKLSVMKLLNLVANVFSSEEKYMETFGNENTNESPASTLRRSARYSTLSVENYLHELAKNGYLAILHATSGILTPVTVLTKPSHSFTSSETLARVFYDAVYITENESTDLSWTPLGQKQLKEEMQAQLATLDLHPPRSEATPHAVFFRRRDTGYLHDQYAYAQAGCLLPEIPATCTTMAS